MTAYRSFSKIPRLAYGLIMADPPWDFEIWSQAGEHKSPHKQYDCVSTNALEHLPLGDVARKDCLLWLWAVNPMLPQAFELMASWGFAFVTAGHWVKTTSNDAMSWGTGYRLRSCGEPYLISVKSSGEIDTGRPFLLGTMGTPKQVARDVPSVILGEARQHSRKPEEAYAAAERMMPTARRLDLFSRQNRKGWDAFGDEVGKFEEAAAQ